MSGSSAPARKIRMGKGESHVGSDENRMKIKENEEKCDNGIRGGNLET